MAFAAGVLIALSPIPWFIRIPVSFVPLLAVTRSSGLGIAAGRATRPAGRAAQRAQGRRTTAVTCIATLPRIAWQTGQCSVASSTSACRSLSPAGEVSRTARSLAARR